MGENEGHRVELTARMTPSASLLVGGSGGQPLQGTSGSLMMMRILAMSPDDRAAFLADQGRTAPDAPIIVLFAMFTPAERAEVIAAAQARLKDQLG